MIKLIIFGSREAEPSFMDIEQGVIALRIDKSAITEIVSGGAMGADRRGEAWAKTQSIGVQRFMPDWVSRGKIAGHIRNEAMATYATHALGFWVANSGGTANMAAHMLVRNKPVKLYQIDEGPRGKIDEIVRHNRVIGDIGVHLDPNYHRA